MPQTKNAHFFFQRDFLDYHGARFRDASYLIYDEQDRLSALFVANRKTSTLYAHQGLTFGGLLWKAGIGVKPFFALFDVLCEELRGQGIRQWVYRLPPRYQLRRSCDELQTALFYLGARRLRAELSAVIPLAAPPRRSVRKRRNIRRGARLRIATVPEWSSFHSLLKTQLALRHGVAPAHTPDDMAYLQQTFPKNIETLGAYDEGRLLGGVTLFRNHYAGCTHAQYMMASPEGRERGALDYLLDYCQQKEREAGMRTFSLGVSTESEGAAINIGLQHWKEEWGAVPELHETYLIDLTRSGRSLQDRLTGVY